LDEPVLLGRVDLGRHGARCDVERGGELPEPAGAVAPFERAKEPELPGGGSLELEPGHGVTTDAVENAVEELEELPGVVGGHGGETTATCEPGT
jgi:hypothetical protein